MLGPTCFFKTSVNISVICRHASLCLYLHIYISFFSIDGPCMLTHNCFRYFDLKSGLLQEESVGMDLQNGRMGKKQ